MFIVYKLYITLIETVFGIFCKFKFSHESLSLNSGLVQYTADLTISRSEYTVLVLRIMIIGFTISCNHYRATDSD